MHSDRNAHGTASSATRLLRDRMTAKRRKIALLMANWEAWQRFQQPDAIVQPWTEEGLLQGQLPWDSASGGQGVTKESLRLALHRLGSELARSKEELQLLPADAANVIRTYRWQMHDLQHAICNAQQEAASLLSSMTGQEHHSDNAEQLLPNCPTTWLLQGRLASLRAHAAHVAHLDQHARGVLSQAGLLQGLDGSGLALQSSAAQSALLS